jgi:hypothetical protein
VTAGPRSARDREADVGASRHQRHAVAHRLRPGHPHLAVAGVIGGFQEGGATDDVTYRPYFGPAVHRLYDQALRAA